LIIICCAHLVITVGLRTIAKNLSLHYEFSKPELEEMPQTFKRFLENIEAHSKRRVPNTGKDWDSSIPHDVRVADKGKGRAENTESERRLVVIFLVDATSLNPRFLLTQI